MAADPVFVLGHPRTGTTHLHNLLALDASRFVYCDTFSVGFPSAFLSLQRLGLKGALARAGVMDDTRPMDNMALSFDSPQEDELATNALSAGSASAYMCIVFMRRWRDFLAPFSALDPGDGPRGGCPPARRARWVASFLSFCRKLILRDRLGIGRKQGAADANANAKENTGETKKKKTLLLKSPVHTARVRLLLKLFPRARFVYLHRDPYRVFQSACHMADTTYWFTYLGREPTHDDITEFVLSQFELLHDEYVAARALIPKGNLIELGFAELTGQDTGRGGARGAEASLRRIYAQFGLAKGRVFDEEVLPRVAAYCAGKRQKGYKKNVFPPLGARARAVIAARWGRAFEEFGYEKHDDADDDDDQE